MKRLLLSLGFVLLFSASSFSANMPLMQWTPYMGIAGFSADASGMRFSSSGSFPLIVSNDNLFAGANQYRYLLIKMRAEKGFLSGRLFFMKIGDKDFSMGNSYDFLTGPQERTQEYLIDLWKSPNWFGTISRLMLSPGASDGNFEISGISLLEPTFLLGLRSNWQEFFAFEIPQMRTVNFIYGPRINGVTVNVYLYWAILFAAILIFAFNFAVKKDLGKIFLPSSKAILIFCIICWIGLDARHALDQARAVQMDSSIFIGKTLEERRAAVTLGDFYPFVAFCQGNIPVGSKYEMLAPTYYYFSEKATYYLYPIRLAGKDEKADYVIVYDPAKQADIEQSVKDRMSKGYRLYKTFKEWQFILKK
jgi:hypothetical protein